MGTHKAVFTTVQGDGGGDGKSFATGPSDVAAGDTLIVCVVSSANADTIGTPANGTWAEITLPDVTVTSSGGLGRVYRCQNPANSTTYAFTLSGGRRSLVAGLASGLDTTNCVDQASSLESAAGTNHAPPSVIPGASGELVYDFAWHRQFSPDTANWSVPASGLTWTERADVQGADGNNNIRLALGSAVAGSSGVAISTTAWTTTDANEESMVVRIALKDAAGAGASGSAVTTAHANTAATGKRTGIGTGTGTAHVSSIATGKRGAAGTASTVGHGVTQATTATVHGGPAVSSTHAAATATGRKQALGVAATVAHPATLPTGTRRGIGSATTTGHPAPAATGRRGATGTARTQARPVTGATGQPTAPDTGPTAYVGVESTGSAVGQLGGAADTTTGVGSTPGVTGLVG